MSRGTGAEDRSTEQQPSGPTPSGNNPYAPPTAGPDSFASLHIHDFNAGLRTGAGTGNANSDTIRVSTRETGSASATTNSLDIAPTLAPSAPSASSAHSEPRPKPMTRRVIASGRSCLECRRRKIKCDRSLPCAYCVRTKIQCTYPSTKPKPSTNSDGDLAARVQSLETALRSLERKMNQIGDMLQGKAGGSEFLAAAAAAASSSHNVAMHGDEQDADNSLSSPNWGSPANDARFNNSPYNSGTANTQIAGSASTDSHHQPPYWQNTPFEESLNDAQGLETPHPSTGNILFMWQTYLDIVDPVFKILHVPSTQRLVMSVTQGRKEPDAPTECIMFAIYYSTSVAMSAAECVRELEEERLVLQRRYRVGLERALLHAGFPGSQNLSVLQCFLIYLLCGWRDENGPDVATLIRAAIEIAHRMSLHCDVPGLSTFEREMRRRVWWHIMTLDHRIAEDYGGEPIINEPDFSTELPFNINDISLDPDTGDIPRPPPGRSEMLFSLVRFEISHLTRQLVYSEDFNKRNGYRLNLSETQKCQLVDKLEEKLESQYLQYCDVSVPFDYVTAASDRLIMVKLKLAICKPRIDENRGIVLRENYRKACEEVLQRSHALRQYKKGLKYVWLFQTYVEWDALAYLLLDLCISPSSSSHESTDTLWNAVDESFTFWKNKPDVHRDRRWTHIEELRHYASSVKTGSAINMFTAQQAAHLTQAARGGSPYSLETPARSEGSDNHVEMAYVGNQHMSAPPSHTDNRIIPVTSHPHNHQVPDHSVHQVGHQTPSQHQSPLQNQPQHPQHAHFSSPEPSGVAMRGPANEVPLLWSMTNAAPTSGDGGQPMASNIHIPGGSAGYDWSAALIERYWEIAGPPPDHDANAWHQ